MDRRRPRYVASALGGVVLLGLATGGVAAARGAGASGTASVTGTYPVTCTTRAGRTACSAPAASAEAPAPSPSPYRDGTYGVRGHYETPGGPETLGVSVTLAAGLVTGAVVTVEAKSPTAQQFQRQFSSRYASQVVARELSSVAVTRVAGASLTSVGFDRAIAQIRSDARV